MWEAHLRIATITGVVDSARVLGRGKHTREENEFSVTSNTAGPETTSDPPRAAGYLSGEARGNSTYCFLHNGWEWSE